jgi:hypothetical protein
VPIFGGHSFTVNGLIHLVCAFLEVGHGLLSVKEQNQIRHSGEIHCAEVDQRPLGKRVRTLRHLVVELPEGRNSRPRSSPSPKFPHPTEMR